MALDVEQVRTRLPGRRIEWHAEIDTTMHAAERLADAGAAAGTVVGAERQRMGPGRVGGQWDFPPGVWGWGGGAAGTVVGAETQRMGQGRLGRKWHSPAGEGLYFTEILRLDL